MEPVPCRAGRGRGGRSRGAGERGAAARRCPAAGNPGGRGPAAPLTPASPSPRVQGQAEWREGEAQAAGSARHGATPQAVALQAPRQPVPHQDREDPLGARLADDAGAGNRGGRAGPRRVRADLHLAPPAREGWGGCRRVLVLPLPPQRMLRACRKRLGFLSILPINSVLVLGSGGVAWCFVGGGSEKSTTSCEKVSGNLDSCALYWWVQMGLPAVIFKLECASESPGGCSNSHCWASRRSLGWGQYFAFLTSSQDDSKAAGPG